MSVSKPPNGKLTMKEWWQTAAWVAGIIFGVLGTTWGFAVAFADLQDEDEVKERLAPVVVQAAATEQKVVGIQVKIAGYDEKFTGIEKEQSRLADSQDKMGRKFDVVMMVVMESAEYQRAALPQQARPRAKRRAAARAARVMDAADSDDGDPLGALEDP